GRPESFRALDELLSEQWFRLSYWKVATEEINYRRFFGINDLIVLRMEEPAVYDETHRFLLRMVREGLITGLRVDHIDGLYDPTGYLARLRADAPDCYLVVEKILQPDEPLPPFWPVQGTTGYDFLDAVTRLLCDQRRRGLRALYARFTGVRQPFDELAADAKGVIIERYLLSDADNLARLLKRISARDRRGRDLTIYGLKRAITELMECFPVYRTYISPLHHRDEDRAAVRAAAARARERHPELQHELRFLERFLSLEFNDDLTEEERREWIRFVMRFQQYTGPLMAKGVEDTALYRYNRLLSMNDVGGAPWATALSPAQWHDLIRRRSAAWPHTMNATATHDTKRGEDVRARLNVLSELSAEWKHHLAAWSRANRKLKSFVRGRLAPDRNDEYLLYQTLLGTAPLDADLDDAYVARIQDYMRKVIREAKRHGGWLAPDEDYERAATEFVAGVLGSSEFARSFLPFLRRVGHYGVFNSLSQTLLKITCPGIPDFYQGAELWDLSLVDPDNRRPVDFDRRTAILEAIRRKERAHVPELLAELLAAKTDGRIKLFVIYRALRFRARHRALFETGRYDPIEVKGRRSRHVVAYARRREEAWAITVAPRLTTALTGEKDAPCGRAVWGDTQLALPDDAPRGWRNAVTGERLPGGAALPVGEILARFPVALLSNVEPA
ncbi:MAG: malto-oligosyltrehalose synthase, partial [Nitrospirota bacterium]